VFTVQESAVRGNNTIPNGAAALHNNSRYRYTVIAILTLSCNSKKENVIYFIEHVLNNMNV